MTVLFVSYGNDSIALIQWMREHSERPGICVFSDTGWAADSWMKRVCAGENLAIKYGHRVKRIESIGMEELARQRKGWPSNQYQFCTAELKIYPALRWLDLVDPKKEMTCVIGIRREESRARNTFPEWTEHSEKHAMRSLWAPLVRVREQERNDLISRAGFEVLPHRSMECSPCVNANRNDLRLLDRARISEIAGIESRLGCTSKGNPRYMFRPKRFGGACGIVEVVAWANKPDGRTQEGRKLSACDSGWCG